MLKVSKQRILEKLNPYAREGLKSASELCIEQGGYEITVAHLLLALLEQPGGDVSKLMSALGINPERLGALVRRSFEKLKRGSSELPQFSPLLLEVLQDAMTLGSLELGEEDIRTGMIFAALAQSPDRYCHFYLHSEFENIDDQAIIKGFHELVKGSMEGPIPDAKNAAPGPMPIGESALQKFCRNITAEAAEGKIDPIFCRDKEIALMTDILSRRRKNNPILVGEPGVGKTALAEGLALKIVENDVPEGLQGAILWELDMGALQAGASVKGEFERRLKGVLDEVLNSPAKIILFIDEAHTLIGGGGQAGGSDAANLLKPALARGQLRAIAATTWSEYKKYFEKDPALTRRFQLIKLDEPTSAQSVTILRGLRDTYEKAHNVFISDAALHAACALSERYLTGRQLPDKAFDVLDTACVRVAAGQTARPISLNMLDKQIQMLERERADVERDTFLRAQGAVSANLGAIDARLAAMQAEMDTLQTDWTRENEIVKEIIQIRGELLKSADEDAPVPDTEETQAKQDKIQALAKELEQVSGRPGQLVNYEVGAEIVATVISDWTGVPASAMSDDDAGKILDLGKTLKGIVCGQDQAIDIIHDRLKAARLDLVRKNTPRGVFLLVGPSGVGKTETAEQVAVHLFGGRQFITTINMSEYQEKHTVSRLIGSPPGYVGYGEGGVLTEAIRRKPYSVVLLDEVEKAHPDVMNLFYQAFDKGVLNDGEGREIDCKNIIFFMTSNLGSDAIMENKETVATASAEALEKALRPHLETHFKPALLARMRILTYKPLDDATIASIISLKLATQAELLRSGRGIMLTWDDSCVAQIASLCSHSENGARMIEQVIDRWLVPPIAEEALQRITSHHALDQVNLSARDGGFELEFLPEIKQLETAAQ